MNLHLVNLVKEVREMVQERFRRRLPEPLLEFGISGESLREAFADPGCLDIDIETIGTIFRLTTPQIGEWVAATSPPDDCMGA